MRQKRRSYREPEDDDDVGDDLATVNERLDTLTRQLERMAQANAGPRAGAPGPDERADRVTDALARLDRRLDQVIAEGRATASEFQQRARYAPPAPSFAPPTAPPYAAAPPYVPASPPPPRFAPAPQQFAPPPPPPTRPSRGPANWAAQISARQRALDGGPAAAAAPVPAVPAQTPQAHWAPSPDLSGLEHQLHQINTQISTLHQPYEHALGALRAEIADIGRALTDALPRRAIEALEAEVRALGERVDHTKQAGADGDALSAVERELAEVRNALRSLTPAENLGGFEEAIRGLYQKIDQIADASHPAQHDPMAFKQLEQAVISLRGVVSNVASDGALAQLSAEVRGLGAQFERATTESSTESLGRLETRIAALMESGRAVPPELEGSIRQLSERLDRMQLTQGDQLALGALEDRIAKLSEKLDASDARLGQLESIERGLADLLVHLEEMRNSGPRSLRAPASPDPTPTPPAPPRPMPVVPAAAPAPALAPSPLDLIPEVPTPNPAMPEPTLAPAALAPPPTFAPPPPPAPPMAPQPTQPRSQAPVRQMPRGPQRQPIDPNLPADTPLEPGSGAPRVKPGSAAARIAASEAALGSVRPMPAETGGKSAAIAAARHAVKAAYLDTPVKVPKSFGAKPPRWMKWPFKKAAKDMPPVAATEVAVPALPPLPSPPPMVSTMPQPLPFDDGVVGDDPVSRGKRVMKLLKTLLIAASVAIIVVGVAQTAMEMLFPGTPSTPNSLPAKDQSQSPPESQPKPEAPESKPGRPMPTPEGSAPAPADPEPTNSISNSSFFNPSTIIKLPDVTGSISRKPVQPHGPASTNPPAARSDIESLPASVSPVLRTAALANDPAAEYELGTRYAEGRGFAQNMPEAVRWFERAAGAGFAPAQFRLASLNEKGDGMKKDVQAARRLYLAAASQGHAKAMHNLAVLYAEGIDGKPDYKVAAEWFRKAATYGVTDSQYNLAILYARGIGVQTNLAEAYRWFALAASNGDNDAARKRDEVAARLDQRTAAAAKLAAQSFVAEHEPDEATNLKTPPGGWDRAPVVAAKPHRQAPASRP